MSSTPGSKSSQKVLNAAMANRENNLYAFGGLRFDAASGEIVRNNESIALSPKQTALLRLLLDAGGDFVSKDQIFATVWADAFVEDGVLTQNIYKLRKALGNRSDGHPIIENKARFGYRVTVPVDRSGDDQKKPSTEVREHNKLNLGVAVACTFGLIVLGVLAYFGYRRYFDVSVITVSRSDRIVLKKVTDSGDVEYATISPDGKFVAFARNPGSTNAALFIRETGNGAETKINLSNVQRLGLMQFSADADHLYVRNRASNLIAADVMKVSRFGGEAVKVAENVWGGFVVSADGRRMFLNRLIPEEKRGAVVMRDLENGNETEVLSIVAPETLNNRVASAVSSDGRSFAAVVNKADSVLGRIVVGDLVTGKLRDLVIPKFRQVEGMVWIPKSDRLLVAAGDGKFYQLWEVAVSDGKAVRVTNALANHFSPSITSDGRTVLTTQNTIFSNIWQIDLASGAERQLTFGNANREGMYGLDYLPSGEIVYSSNAGDDGALNIWRLDPVSGKKSKLTENVGRRNDEPNASNDGRSVYFTSDRSGKASIWEIDAEGGNPRQITNPGAGSDSNPRIAPDGRWLYFLRRTAKGSAVFRISRPDGTEEQLTETEKFSPTSFLTISPDGKYLAFHDLTPEGQPAGGRLHRVIVFEIESRTVARELNLGGRVPRIVWTPDGGAFDLIAPMGERDEIQRIDSGTGDSKPRMIRSFDDVVYFLVHTKNGETALISRGRNENDAVLLTNFE